MKTSSTRRALLGLAAVGGLGGGLWLALRRSETSPLTAGTAPAAAGSASAASAATDPMATLFTQQFDTPDGQVLDLAALRGKPLLINFWATWCPPCVKELPEIDQFALAFARQGGAVIGLAIDGPTPVRDFLKKTPVKFPIGLAGLGGTELAQALGNDAGGLPFTVLIDAAGTVRQRKMGATHLQELQQWAQALA